MGFTSIFPVSSVVAGHKPLQPQSTKLEDMSLDQILKTYDLPHRLLAYFASQCAKDALIRADVGDPRSMLAVDVAERFGNGEDFSQEYLQKVCDDVYDYAYYASSAAPSSFAASAAYYAANAAASSAYAASASSAAYAAANAATYKDLLLKLIDERLTPLEKLLILG